jgi:Sulfotransferase family
VNLTFVVGTGRCGSTMLSRMLHQHPDVLSVSEFFNTLQATMRRTVPTENMNGQTFWAMLSKTEVYLDAQICAGLKPPEECYPYGRGRFDIVRGVPSICHYVLPMLTDEPDALFDQLAADVPAWPRRAAADQYRALFRYLADAFERRAIVERSGLSIALVSLLHEQFPEARFVHMYRDGPDCALSMSRHPTLRRHVLTTLASNALRMPPSATPEEIQAASPEDFKGVIAPPFDAERLMTHPVPVTHFARFWWSEMTCRGLTELRGLPENRWMNLKYEELLREPARELERLAKFVGVQPSPDWLHAARTMIDPSKVGKAAAQLDPATLASLCEACGPGNQAIDAMNNASQ